MKTRWIVPVLFAAACAGAAETASTNTLALPGVTADRAARTVRVQARATGLAANLPAEFLLIAKNSGHDYEAIAATDAKPSDVHRALEFIGLAPGRPVEPSQTRFWPRGERVRMSFARTGGAAVPAEETILDRRTGRPMPADGFVFVGSQWITPEGGGAREYAADTQEPNAILPAFNLATAVLDIPRRGSQSELYDAQVCNPARVFGTNEALEVVFTPEPRTNGLPRVTEITLGVSVAVGGGLAYALTDAAGAALAPAGAPAAVAAALDRLAAEQRDAFVTVRIGDTTPARALTALRGEVELLVERHGARIEPPPEGHIYYRGFSPDPSYRDRASRPAQPWELRLSRKDGRVTGVLAKVEPSRDLITNEAKFITTDFPVDGPAALRAALDREGPGLPVILVYAPGDTTYGELVAFLKPSMTTHPVIHVITE